MYVAFVIFVFVLGIWVGTGWFAHIVRKQRALIEETESRIDRITAKWKLYVERREQELEAQRAREHE